MFLRCLISFLILSVFGCGPRDPEAELHRAARLGDEKNITALLQAGEDVNKVIDGMTPLLEAAESVRPEAMALLLEKGANVEVKDSKGRDAWDLLLLRGQGRFLNHTQVKGLIVLIDQGVEPRMTLIDAAQKVDSDIFVESLVKAGADIKIVDERGWTALHHAASIGNADACEALIKAGADLNAETTVDFFELNPTGEDDTHVTDKFRYQAGSRPLDVVKDRVTRASRSAEKVLLEAGATNNPKVKNRLRY